MSAYCNAESAVQVQDGRVALLEDDVLRILCERVAQAGEQYRRRNEAAAAAALENTEQGDAALYVKSAAAVSQGVALAACEAAEPPLAQSPWHTVIASIPKAQSSAVPRVARALAPRLRQAGLRGDLQVYLTRLSDSYALTLGPATTREEATHRAKRARESGVVRDAFAQPDRAWKRVPVGPGT